MRKQGLIVHDFNLPNHSNELSKVEEVIEKYQKKFKAIKSKNTITDIEHTTLFEETVSVLNYLGKLSMPAFEIEDELEEMYMKQYMHSPELAKKLWLDHFAKIHHPYNLLKNRCFKLLDDLDEMYISVNKKNPPNWKY